MFRFIEIKNYKQLIKEKEELKLADLVKKQNIHQENIKSFNVKIPDIQDKIRKIYDTNFNLSLIKLYNENIEQIKISIKEEESKLDKIKQEISNQKIKIKEASIDFKKFEKLEEIHKENNLKLEKYNNDKELDEINSIREYHKN